ncbi:hypothetical protein K438DRAFT_1772707 [Mycena galopus ATCC 62051]|nr:hypothetical protein K438DRAFT_1772707 [Mycena galopus ATCC 62051]
MNHSLLLGHRSRHKSSPAPVDPDTVSDVKSEIPVETFDSVPDCRNCARSVQQRNYAFEERDVVDSQWRAALRERDELQEELMRVEEERAAAVLERDEWRRAAVQLVDVAGTYIPRH